MNGSGSAAFFEKLGETEAELDRVTRRVEELRREIVGLENQLIDEKDLERTIQSFSPIR